MLESRVRVNTDPYRKKTNFLIYQVLSYQNFKLHTQLSKTNVYLIIFNNMRVDWSLVFNCKSSWCYWRVDKFRPKFSKLFTVLVSSIVHENVPPRYRYIRRIAYFK